jgi:Na+/H+-translocating membrane pyrophosphatase
MVALALFGGFLRNASLDSLISEEEISLTEPLIFTGLLLGAMLPFAFAGLVIRSINNAAQWVAG